MRLLFVALLFLAVVVPPAAGRPQADAPERPRDPWVYRTTLDGRPGLVVLALDETLWAAYDPVRCTLHAAWRGERSDPRDAVVPARQQYLESTLGTIWRARIQGQEVDARPRFLGYRLDGIQATLLYEIIVGDDTVVRVEETPDVYIDEDGRTELIRRFETEGLPEDAQLEVEMGLDWLTDPSDVTTAGIGFFQRFEGEARGEGRYRRFTLKGRLILFADEPTVLSVRLAPMAPERIAFDLHTFDGQPIDTLPAAPVVQDMGLVDEQAAEPADRRTKAGAGGTSSNGATPNDDRWPLRTALDPDAPGGWALHPAFEAEAVAPALGRRRLAVLAALPDGRVALATSSGTVFVTEAASPDETPTLKRVAGGLAGVRGLVAFDGDLLVAQVNEVTRLSDENDDGVIDAYRVVARGWNDTSSVHLETAGMVGDGQALRLMLSGEASDSTGRRQPRTLVYGIRPGRNPAPLFRLQGDRLVDGQGANDAWVATARPGQRPGYVTWRFYTTDAGPLIQPAHDTLATGLRMPVRQDTSAGGSARPVARWLAEAGPYAGHLIVNSGSDGALYRIAPERVDGVWQGAVFPVGERLGSEGVLLAGVADGALLIAPRRQPDGGPGVVRLTTATADSFDVVTIRARHDGLRLTFTRPIDETVGNLPESYRVERLASRNGVPLQEARSVKVNGVLRSRDGLHVDLEFDVDAGGFYYLTFEGLTDTEEAPILTREAWFTLNRVPEGNASRAREQE